MNNVSRRYTYVGWPGRLTGRYGKECWPVYWPGTRKGCISNIVIEFADGERVVTSRRCVRRIRDEEATP